MRKNPAVLAECPSNELPFPLEITPGCWTMDNEYLTMHKAKNMSKGIAAIFSINPEDVKEIDMKILYKKYTQRQTRKSFTGLFNEMNDLKKNSAYLKPNVYYSNEQNFFFDDLIDYSSEIIEGQFIKEEKEEKSEPIKKEEEATPSIEIKEDLIDESYFEDIKVKGSLLKLIPNEKMLDYNDFITYDHKHKKFYSLIFNHQTVAVSHNIAEWKNAIMDTLPDIIKTLDIDYSKINTSENGELMRKLILNIWHILIVIL